MKINALTQNETTPDVFMENPNWEKPREPMDSEQNHYKRCTTE